MKHPKCRKGTTLSLLATAPSLLSHCLEPVVGIGLKYAVIVIKFTQLQALLKRNHPLLVHRSPMLFGARLDARSNA